MSDYLTKSEIIVLVDERIEKHDEAVNEPKHVSNTTILAELRAEVKTLVLQLTEMKATQSIVMKFAGAGIMVWSLRQIVEMVQSFKH